MRRSVDAFSWKWGERMTQAEATIAIIDNHEALREGLSSLIRSACWQGAIVFVSSQAV